VIDPWIFRDHLRRRRAVDGRPPV